MAHKRKRSNGSYEATIKCKALIRKAITKTFKTEAECDGFIAYMNGELKKGRVPLEYQSSQQLITIESAIRAFLKSNEGKRDNENRLRHLNLISKRFGKQAIGGVDKNWAEVWIEELRKVYNLTPETIRKYKQALSQVLDWFIEHRHPKVIETNALKRLSRNYSTPSNEDHDSKRDSPRDRRLSLEEETAIQSYLNDEATPTGKENREALLCMFILATETAMRMREIFCIQLRGVQLNNRTIQLYRTKTGKKRTVPLSTLAVEALDNYFKVAKKKHASPTETDFIFPYLDYKKNVVMGKNSEMVIARATLDRVSNSLSTKYTRIFKAAGVKNLRFHDLRHEATSRLYERTTLRDIEISSITGHRNLESLKRYTHLRAKDLVDQMW
jgi:integrase